jgi:hypothetical protein
MGCPSKRVNSRFVIQTRQGGRNRCSLFGLAWFAIDYCDGKLDVSPTHCAPIDWKSLNNNLSEPPAVQCAPPAVQSGEKIAAESIH